MTDSSVLRKIDALRRMSVGELHEKWRELYDGEEPRSRNKYFLWRRLAWRVQELAYGGLSERAKARIKEIQAMNPPIRVRPPRGWEPPANGDVSPKTYRDERLPAPGTVLTRTYRGEEYRVTVLDDGFEWDGRHFKSLSAVARAITGQKWNGPLFFGLTKRKR